MGRINNIKKSCELFYSINKKLFPNRLTYSLDYIGLSN